MNKFVGYVVSAVAVVGFSACGGDDSGSSTSGVDVISAGFIKAATDQGLEIDEKCINDVFADLNDADVTIMTENLAGLLDGSADMNSIGISEDGVAILQKTFDCVIAS